MAETIKIVLTVDDSQVSIASQRVGTNLKQIQRAMQDTADSTKRIDQHFTGLSGKFRDLVATAGLLRFALYDIRDVFGATIGKVVESSAQIERMTKLMEGLSTATSAQGKLLDANNNRDFVINFAKNAPFEVKALTDSFVKLKAAGLDPTKGSFETIVNSVSKFGGSSESLQRVSVAIQQMAGKGVISMEELRQQLGEAIPTAMRSMAEGMGLSMGDMVKHISKGEVGSTDALRRMLTVMKFENAGAAEALNQTWYGQIEKLKTNFTLFANQIGKGGFFDSIKASLAELNSYFESTAGKDLSLAIGQSLKSIIDSVTSATKILVDYGTEIKQIGKVIAVIWTASAVKTGLTDLSNLVGNYSKNLRQVYSAETSLQNTRVIGLRAAAIEEGKANISKIYASAEASRIQIAQLALQYEQQMALKIAYEKEFAVADNIARTRQGANGRFVSAEVQKNNAAMAVSFSELAIASEVAALRFSAAEAAMAVSAQDTMVKVRASSIATAESIAAIGVSASATSIGSGLLKTAMFALLDPIVLITLAVTAGIAAWTMWGGKAEEAAKKAASAIAKTKAGLADMNTAAEVSAGLDDKRKQLKEKGAEIQSVSLSSNQIYKKNQLPILAKEYKDIRDAITLGEKDVDAALKQGQTNFAASYASGSMKNIEVANVDAITKIRDASADKLKVLRELSDTDKTKAKQISEEAFRANSEITNLQIEANNRNIKKLDENIIKNAEKIRTATNAKDKAIYEQQARNQTQLKIALSDNATTLSNNSKDVNNNATAFSFNAKKDKKSASDSSPVISKIEALINQLKDKNIALSTEGKKATDTLAKLEYDLEHTDKYVEKGKKGVRIPPTAVEKNKVLSLARKNVILEGLDEDAQKLEKTNKEIAKNFEEVQKTWADGDAKYKAALSNFESNGKGDSKEFEKTKNNMAKVRVETVKYYSSIGASAEAAKVALDSLDKIQSETLAKEGGAKALILAQSLKDKTQSINLSLIENASERATAEGEITVRSLEYQYQQTMLWVEKGSADEKKLTDAFNAAKLATIKEFARKAETPMQSLTRSWLDTTTQMQSASTRWANSTVDAFIELAKTGKTSFSGLVDSILTDILRIALQKQLSGALNSVFGAIEKTVGGLLKGPNAENPGIISKEDAAKIALTKTTEALSNAAKDAAMNAGELSEGLGESAIESVLQAGKSSTVSGAMSYLQQAATNAANALSQLAASGGASGGSDSGGLFSGIGDFFSNIFGGGISGSESGAASALGMSGQSYVFANGGIMTNMGAVELRKYANGGIANKPQAAIFGEGSMNEAYVPLPDGKTIPVTMSGNGASASAANVTVNVINAPAGSTTQQSTNSDGSTSIDVIIAQVEGKISQNVAKGRGSLSQVMEKTYSLNRATGSYR